MTWTSQEAEDFERSWLLLADVYIQGGKGVLNKRDNFKIFQSKTSKMSEN